MGKTKTKSPGKNKRRKQLSDNKSKNDKSEIEQEPLPSPSQQSSPIPSSLSTPKRSKIVNNVVIQVKPRTAEKGTSTKSLDNELLELMLQNQKQANLIKSLKKRVVEVERQRDHWKLRALRKPEKPKDTSSKQLSAIDDMLFCVKFDLSTKKRRTMKAFLREKQINFFAKNEEVRKLELVKQIASNFEYKETTVTDKNEKEKIIHSCVSRDPLSLITLYLTYLDNNKKLNAINKRIRAGISGDDGRGWTKICLIPIDVPLSSSRDNALVLAIWDAKDNYEYILKFCNTLFGYINNILTIEINGVIYEVELFAIGDMCFLCALFGHAGHSAKYPCLMCYITKGNLKNVGPLRTWEEMLVNFENKEFSQKHLPILKCKVANIVPSVLHIPLGVGSDGLKILEKLEYEVGKTGSIKNILSRYNLSRHPLTKQLNGNDMRKFLTTATIFTDLRKVFDRTPKQEVADIVIDVCSTLGLIQGMMSIKVFDEHQLLNLKNLIQRFKALYISSPLSFTPKGHWLVFHGPEFVEKHRIWGSASEHGQEAIHGSTDDDMYRYRSLPIKKKLELVVRNCILRNLVFAKNAI